MMASVSRLPYSKTGLRGFTLIELIVAVTLLVILSGYAMTKKFNAVELTLPSQAQRLASDIGLAQTYAYTSGSHMRITAAATGPVTNGTYTVACVACPSGTTLGTLTGGAQKGAKLSVSPTTVLEFDTQGKPTSNVNYIYTLEFSGEVVTVTVEPITGNITIAP